MLRAAFRSKRPKGAEQGNNNYDSSDSEEEFYEEPLEKSDEVSVTSGKDSKEFAEDSNVNSSSNSEILEANKQNGTPASEDESFPYTEREIYEVQLVQLQEQLVAAIISEQEKDAQLKKYQEVDVEKLRQSLKEEQEKNADLADKLKILKNKLQNSKLARTNASKSDPRKPFRNSKNLENESDQLEDWVDVNAEDDNQEKEKSDKQDVQPSPSESSSHSDIEAEAESSTPQLPRIRSVKDKPDGTSKPAPRYFDVSDFKNRVVEAIVDRLWDFVNEETDLATEENEEEDALSVKKLKENINRFSNRIKPITNFVKCVGNIISWTNIAATFLTFVVYMYAARHGYLFSLLLLTILLILFKNYLYARGIAAQIGMEVKEKDEPNDDKSLSDKFQLVLEVAKKVQNTLGKMADSLEKIKNLLMWQHPATNKLFLNLWLVFIASLFLSGPTLFMFMALGLGIKIFISRPIFDKFPKAKKRYDDVARVWSELPTDADLAIREENKSAEYRSRTQAAGQNTTDASSSNGLRQNSSNQAASQSWLNFCEKVKIPLTEKPLPSWEEGHRCTLMNKDKPLTNMKNGRLYLTQNYLCFERNKSSKHIAIKLENIAKASKCKPIHMLPGTGMAIEIEAKGSSKPYIFAALLGRDDLFESLMMTGRAANYRWAS